MSLPEEQRVPLLLRVRDNLSYHEIARRLGIRVEAVALQICSAREEVRSAVCAAIPNAATRPPTRAT